MTAWETPPDCRQANIILIASQDLKMAAAWELIFKQRRCWVVHETTPRHALQAARLLLPDLTIIDLDLTPSERLSLCKQLRPLTKSALLLLTLQTSERDTLEYLRAGVDESLPPTISPAKLLSKALAWLAK